MTARLAVSLAVGRLVFGYSVIWLFDQLVVCLFGRLAYWLFDCLVSWPIGLLAVLEVSEQLK